jgi:hypothetical protein
MALLWLLDAALSVVEWLLGLFTFLPVIDFPGSLTLLVPVPLVGSVGVDALNVFVPTAIAVALALIAGRVLQWLYQLIPFKFT